MENGTIHNFDFEENNAVVAPDGQSLHHDLLETRLTAFITASANLFSKRTFHQLAASILNLAIASTGATFGCIAMLDENNEHLRVIALQNNGKAIRSHFSVMPQHGLIKKVLRSKKPLYVNDISTAEISSEILEMFPQTSRILISPCIFRRRSIGIVMVGNKKGAFDVGDVAIIEAFSRLVTIGFADIRARDAIRASEEKFRQFFNNEPNYCLIVSPEGLIMDANQAYLSIISVNRSSIMGKPWWHIFEDSSLAQIQPLTASVNPLILQDKELILRATSGPPRHVMATTSIITGKNKEVLHYIIVLNDISLKIEGESEQRRLLDIYRRQSESLSQSNLQLKIALRQVQESEKKLQSLYEQEKRLRDELEAEARKRADFTRALVHELKTPLVPLVASSSLLSDGLHEEPWQSIAANIERGALNLSNRIEELLDVARGEVGALTINPVKMQLSPLLEEIITEIRDLASVRRLTLRVNIPAGLPPVNADPVRLRQVIVNLLNNSVKYTPEGGDVSLSVTSDDHHISIAIRDTGLGIPADDLSNLFTSYYRASNSRLQYHGMGIGLYLSKKIIELHGGDITVESQENSGSVFTVTLPACKSKPAFLSSGKPGHFRVLIVHHDASDLNSIAVSFRNSWPQASLDFAAGGNEAVEKSRQEYFHAIVLFLELPDVDGLDVLRTLRDITDAPVAVISSNQREDIRKNSISLGICASFIIPFSTDALVEKLKSRVLQRLMLEKGNIISHPSKDAAAEPQDKYIDGTCNQ